MYDIADIFKFETVVPLAFKIAAREPSQPDREVRIACRDAFREHKTLAKIIPIIDEVLKAGEIELPKMPEESIPPAIPEAEGLGEAGHRSK